MQVIALHPYKKKIRRLLIFTKMARIIRSIDTFIFVYTNHAAILGIYVTVIMLTFPLTQSTNLIYISAIIPSTVFLHILLMVIRDFLNVKKINKPKLFVHAQGDILECKTLLNRKRYIIGSAIIGYPINISLYIHTVNINYNTNYLPSITSLPNKSVTIELELSNHKIHDEAAIYEYKITLVPQKVESKRTNIHLQVHLSKMKPIKIILQIKSIFDEIPLTHISEMKVKGWKYGKKAALCCRTDFCFINPKKGMSKDTLNKAIKIGKKYGIPFTLFISGRLTLDFDEFVNLMHNLKYFSVEEAIKIFNEFIFYLKSLAINQKIEYPNFSGSVSIGSHSYLHQGKFAGVIEKTNWNGNWNLYSAKVDWLINAAERYGLRIENPNHFTFNQLNAGLINNLLLYKTLGVYPRSWSAPRNETTETLATEIEKIGIIYASEADNYKRISKTFFPRRPKAGPCLPYHPKGCTRLIESRCVINPNDLYDIFDLHSLRRTLKYCIKKGYQMTFLIHPHLNVHKTSNGPILTELFFQKICENLDNLWVASHESVLTFWELTRCSTHSVLYMDARNLSVSNLSDKNLDGVCILVKLSTGEEFVKVINLKPRETVYLFKKMSR